MKTGERGAAMMISLIFFIVASVLVVIGMTGPSAREYRTASDSLDGKHSYFAAESAAEDAYYRLKNGMTIGSTDTLTFLVGTATATIAPLSPAQTEISSVGSVYNSQQALDIKHNDGSVNYDINSWAQTR